MRKILTIVVPTYNMEKLLENDLTSLVVSDELMNAIEVLVINDGSKDSSSEIGHRFQCKYPQTFKIIDKPNGNYGSCVNRGLQEATGKYIKIMDADDTYEKKGFEELLTVLESSDYDMVLTDVVVDYTLKKKKVILDMELPRQTSLTFDEFVKGRNLSKISMHAITYKTSNLKRIKYIQTEGISYTDQEWLFLPMTTVNSLYYLGEAVYHYNIGREGQTMNRKVILRGVSQREMILLRMLEQYNGVVKNQSDSHKKYLYARLLFMTKGLYEDYLVKSPMIDSEELQKFDETLGLNNAQLYLESAGFRMPRINKYNYIKAWRSHSKLRMFPVRLYGVFFRVMARLLN